MLTQERLKELLDYDPETGVMVWRGNRGGKAVVGAEAGTRNTRGYIIINVDGKFLRRARLAFMWMLGRWPIPEADHDNRVRDDDRWENLKDATRLMNLINREVLCTNTSGYTGVSKNGVNWGRAYLH